MESLPELFVHPAGFCQNVLATGICRVTGTSDVAGRAAIVLPDGFQQTTVWSGLTQPTAIRFAPDGIVARRQREIFDQALALLEEVAKDGMMKAIGKARFGDTARMAEGGKGLEGVVEKAPGYFNPFLEILEEGR